MNNPLKQILVFLLIVTPFMVSCDRKNVSPANHKTAIAVIPIGTTHEFWKSIHAGAEKAANEMNVDIIWKGAIREDDRDEQIKIVENMIIRNVDGIVLSPIDCSALCRPVTEAVRNDIPVLIFNSRLNGHDFISYVATDNYQGGKKAGRHLAELLNHKGKVILLRLMEGVESTMKREQGFIDAMAEYPGIEIVSSNQYGGSTVETAYLAAENLLAPLRNTQGGLNIDGIFCPNESTTFGMLRAIEEFQLAGKVKFVGFDSSPKLIDAMEKGIIQGLVLQDPINMGYLAVKLMAQHLKGQTIPNFIDTGSVVAAPENMNDPDISARLKPDFQKWLTP